MIKNIMKNMCPITINDDWKELGCFILKLNPWYGDKTKQFWTKVDKKLEKISDETKL